MHKYVFLVIKFTCQLVFLAGTTEDKLYSPRRWLLNQNLNLREKGLLVGLFFGFFFLNIK